MITALSRSNIINECFAIEAEVVDQNDLTEAKGRLLELLRAISINNPFIDASKRSPVKGLCEAYGLLRTNGYSFGADRNRSPLFTLSLNSTILNCQSSSFILLALAKEMGWDATCRAAPSHLFVACDGLNVDRGKECDDDEIDKVWNGCCSDHMTADQIRSIFYLNRANVVSDNSWLADYNRALYLNPNSSAALCSRGARFVSIDAGTAIRDYDKALAICPGNIISKANLAEALLFRLERLWCKTSFEHKRQDLERIEALCNEADQSPYDVEKCDRDAIDKELHRHRALIKRLREKMKCG